MIDSQVRDNVPVVVETGEMVERPNPETKDLELVPETVVQYETRAVYTYEADFDWSNFISTIGLEMNLTWLVDVLQFKNNQLKTGKYAFYAMPVVELTALPDLDTSNLTDMTWMFGEASNFNQPLNNLDTSNAIDMSSMFSGCKYFNQPINHFDFSNADRMSNMFWTAWRFNQPLNNWNVSSVTNMHQMFDNAQTFNQDISNWCVSTINSKPYNFDFMAGFMNNAAKQPQWGQPC